MATRNNSRSRSRSTGTRGRAGSSRRKGPARSTRTSSGKTMEVECQPLEPGTDSRKASSGSSSRSSSRSRSAASSRNRSAATRSRAAASRNSASRSSSKGGNRGTSNSGNRVLTDHGEIRRWAEERDAQPSCVRGTGGNTGRSNVGMIRLDFPGYTGADSLKHIGWDEWFEAFDENGLALTVQDRTSGGERSNFNKLISRNRSSRGGQGARRAA